MFGGDADSGGLAAPEPPEAFDVATPTSVELGLMLDTNLGGDEANVAALGLRVERFPGCRWRSLPSVAVSIPLSWTEIKPALCSMLGMVLIMVPVVKRTKAFARCMSCSTAVFNAPTAARLVREQELDSDVVISSLPSQAVEVGEIGSPTTRDVHTSVVRRMPWGTLEGFGEVARIRGSSALLRVIATLPCPSAGSSCRRRLTSSLYQDAQRICTTDKTRRIHTQMHICGDIN